MNKFEIGKMHISWGKKRKQQGRKAICKICEHPIKENELGITIKALSECPGQYHLTCFEMFMCDIQKAIDLSSYGES